MLARLVAVACLLIGLAGLGALALLVLGLGLGWQSPWEASDGLEPLLVNLALLLLFAVQHSGMARAGFKQVWTRAIPEYLERSVYVAASGVATLGLVIFWQPLPGEPLWDGPKFLVVVPLLAGLALTFVCMDAAEFLGLTQAWQQKPDRMEEKLWLTGPYRFVRHPLMAGALVFLWAQPAMPPTLLLLSGGLTFYIAVGTWLEERDLLRRFGSAYAQYRQRVPALVPWRRPLPRGTRFD